MEIIEKQKTMDIQQFIDNLNKQAKLRSAREFSLRDLIESLKKMDKNLEIIIDNQTFPFSSNLSYAEQGDERGYCEYTGPYYKYNKKTESVFSSWRGSYCELAMEYSKENQHITTGKLLEMAEFIDGKYLCGYKGGDFLMDLDTPIHIDNYGEARNIKLIGIEELNGCAVLITRDTSDDA